jgi:hypothetical protein
VSSACIIQVYYTNVSYTCIITYLNIFDLNVSPPNPLWLGGYFCLAPQLLSAYGGLLPGPPMNPDFIGIYIYPPTLVRLWRIIAGSPLESRFYRDFRFAPQSLAIGGFYLSFSFCHSRACGNPVLLSNLKSEILVFSSPAPPNYCISFTRLAPSPTWASTNEPRFYRDLCLAPQLLSAYGGLLPGPPMNPDLSGFMFR